MRQLLLQPFVNYNMAAGWYRVISPIIAANWLAPSNKWAFPFGGGIGKIFRIGEQPMNASLQALLCEIANRRTAMGLARPTTVPLSAVTARR